MNQPQRQPKKWGWSWQTSWTIAMLTVIALYLVGRFG
jgi:hypothetical protein